MENIRVTSWDSNQPNKFLFINESSIFALATGILIGFILSGKVEAWFPDYPSFKILTPFICGGIGFKCAEYFYSGKYPNERWEALAGKFFFLSSIKKIWIFKERSSIRKITKDTHTHYDLEENEIFGFEIIVKNDASKMAFQSLSENILKDLKVFDQVQFIRVNKDVKISHVFEKSPILEEKRVKGQHYYIFFTFNDSTSKKKENTCKRFELIGRRLSRIEMSAYAEYVFSPRRKTSGKETPIFPMSYQFNNNYAETYSDGFVTAASSLAAIPKHYVGENFNEFLNPIKNLDSIVSVKFVNSHNVQTKIKNTLKVFKLEALDLRKKSNQKKSEAYEQRKIDVQEGRSVNLCMSFSIVVFGKMEEVEKGLAELENNADEAEINFRPIFARETNFLKKVLLAVLPGSLLRNSFKDLKVESTEEAFYYLPQPFMENDLSDERAFPMRTPENSLWLFPYYKPKTTLICGLPGFGKSLLASLFYCANVKSYAKGYPAAGFVLDLGDSFLFLEEGLADFILQLNYDNSIGKYKPLEIHPLELFKPFGDRIKYAQKFLCSIMGFDPSDKTSNTASDGEVVSDSLAIFYNENLTRISEFRKILKENLEKFFGNSAQKQNKMANWEEYIARLNIFCKGGINGEIFDPENPKYNATDIKNIRFFYASKNTQTKDDIELISAFASLVISFADLMEEKFKSGGENESSNFFYCVDEMQWWSEYMPHSWFRERANQNRKFGASLWLITQNLENLIVPKSELEKKTISSPYALLEAVQRFFFYTLPQNLDVVKILARESLNEKGIAIKNGRIEKMYAIANKISEIKNLVSLKKTSIDRIVGYCDEEMNLMPVCVDIDKEQLWSFTTHDGGRAIRKKALKYSGLSYFETCKMMAKWPGQVPENQVSKSYELDILKTVFDLKEINLQ